MIVVGGEALVDLVPQLSGTQSDVDIAPLLPRLGGGPFNTAVGAGRLGAEVSFLSRISTDRFGDLLVERLRASNVDTGMVQRGGEPTMLAVVELTGGAAGYTFHLGADRLVTDPGPLGASVLALGTLGMVLEPGATAYEAVLRREAAAGALTVLDPNVRAQLIPDPDAYRARFASWLPDVRVLKVSEEDAEWLAGTAPADAARSWLRQGPQAVVLTRGAAGLTAFTPDAEVAVPAGRVTVADTIGAGDTVHAALLARLAGGGALDRAWWAETLSYAAAAAAVTVSRVGADPPWAAELR